MRLDEMIIKANADGKTYFCNGTDLEYSKEKGFTGIERSDQMRKFTDIVLVNEWLEKPKRHLTVSEAEKELDCVIDAPDISKLFKSMCENPGDNRNVILFPGNASDNSSYCGFYSGLQNRWISTSQAPIGYPFHWIDPADLIKLLPKE